MINLEAQDREAPKLSLVLPGERPETVRLMRESLRKQTARGSLEIVVIRWPGPWTDDDLEQDGFAAVRVVDVETSTNLPEARARGVRAATAPLVFICETHAYPRPEWAEAVLAAAAAGPWGVVASSFTNANPDGSVSWAGFISDYGAYGDDLPAGEIATAPIHKGIFLRSDLLALGERLAPALSSGDELGEALRSNGRRAYFEPRARIDHRNVPSLGLWLRGRFLIGFLIGANRSERWAPVRRALYVILSPLIAVVLTWRTLPIARRIGRSQHLPVGTRAIILLGSIARAIGEAVGYAFGHVPRIQSKADEYELFESVYAGISSQ